ncbi:hypothetical protein EV363DRAFT_1416571 [Boletus edulis]|nr:hypothetical protein EV363DRAFT_1416571 [Boletus edulis]
MFDMFLESQMPLSGWLKSLKSHPCLKRVPQCAHTPDSNLPTWPICAARFLLSKPSFHPELPLYSTTPMVSFIGGHAIGIYYTSALVTLLIVGDAYRDPLELMPGMTIRESFKSKVVRRLNRALYR